MYIYNLWLYIYVFIFFMFLCLLIWIKFYFYRENLIFFLLVLECRYLSSDDDGLSIDGMDSIYDIVDEEENEEYVLIFDFLGRY